VWIHHTRCSRELWDGAVAEDAIRLVDLIETDHVASTASRRVTPTSAASIPMSGALNIDLAGVEIDVAHIDFGDNGAGIDVRHVDFGNADTATDVADVDRMLE
jgi:hypothetical protein